jgi:tight adherence protein B
MARLAGVVRTKTAEGKAQALVMSFVPIPLYLMIEWLNPGFFEPMKHALLGQILIVTAISLWVTAFLLAHRILRVDI